MLTQSPIYQNVQRTVLDNGLTTLISSSKKSTQTVAVYLAVKTGAADEGKWLGAGLSHFVEHMFFKGTKLRDKGMIEKEVRRIGGDINAYTSHDLTVFYVTALASEVQTAIHLLYDAAFHSVLAQDELEKEREVIISEMRMNEDRLDRKALVALWNRMYTGHPYENPVIGYEPIFRAVTQEDLQTFMSQYYVPNNMVLSVVGDIETEKVLTHVRETFGSVDRKSIEPIFRSKSLEQSTQRFTLIKKPAEHVRLMVAFPTIPAGHPDAPALDVLAEVFGGGNDSRLVQQMKEIEQSAIEVSAFHSSLRDGGMFGVDATVTVNKRDEALQSINAHLKNLIERGIQQDELKRAVTQLLSNHYLSLETNAAVAHELLTNEIVTGDFAFTQSYLQKLLRLTTQDVLNTATKYVLEDKRNQVELRPDQPTLDDTEVQVVDPISLESNVQVDSHILKNGIRVLFDEDDSNPLIYMQIALMGGVLFEGEDISGLSTLVADMLTRGTKSFSQAEITHKFAGWGGTITSYSGRNSFGLTLMFLKQHQAEALELLSEMLLTPAWNDEEFEKVRNESLEDLASQREDIFATASNQFQRIVYGNHPYRLNPVGEEKSLLKLTSQQASVFYVSLRNPLQMVIGMSGAINSKETLAQLNKKIGSMPQPDFLTAMNAGQEFLQTSRKTHAMEREQVVVMVGVPAVTIDHPDRYVLEIINAILSGSAGKLYQYIRGEHGLSYVVGSSLSLGIAPGHFVAYAATSPNEAVKVTELLSKFLVTIAFHGCSEEELQLAKAQLAGHHLHALESKSSRLPQLVSEELLGEGWNSVFNYQSQIDAISLESVNDALKRYFGKNEQYILLTGKLEPTS